ncbi:helix-turn-helix transcriptional regulator [Streptomyces sp. NBC_00582]|uniref:helix-turn-helix transcriptional regulator n=1 Tax=Streptomyces sp. NBC_00582 TaxID=2975783 RepID=UPI002E8033F7|nr:helix-turn-helix transcriptional regulator [Streptomyces sp. NBC_00582]WUB63057.1 helix-turn-helix transcriptional regulator [Streptomyces sp. NBC_00582]
MTSGAHRHAQEVCEPGLSLYARALREGRVARAAAEETPCLLTAGLLTPDPDDPGLLEPVPPAVALHRGLRSLADRVADERGHAARLVETFEPFLRLTPHPTAAPESPAIGVLSGPARINEAITSAMAEARREMLCIQPYTAPADRPPTVHLLPMERDQAFLDRGCRIRTLYQHTLRHAPTIAARYEQIRGDVEARTLDEVTDRLILLDRTVAFVPANKERSLALEVRHPALTAYFATTFERLWELATPMYPEAVRQPTLNGVTPRQRAVATLLVEGHTDAVIADRLGMNVRTTRVHIARLAAGLGSESRAQLGYLIARSGILDQERDPT